MAYIYERGNRKTKMHIQGYSFDGKPLMQAICGIDRPFNTTINEPFRLGKEVCKNCEEKRQQNDR